jgi:predicted nucleic acid-binding protein
MPAYYFDTSAQAKRYHIEAGTTLVNQLVADLQNQCFVSRLGLLELHSLLVKHVRLGNLVDADLHKALSLLHSDLASSLLHVIPIELSQLDDAEALLRRLGPTRSLYALDAFHLAVAQSIIASGTKATVVCSDKRLLALAGSEGLLTLDPGQP